MSSSLHRSRKIHLIHIPIKERYFTPCLQFNSFICQLSTIFSQKENNSIWIVKQGAQTTYASVVGLLQPLKMFISLYLYLLCIWYRSQSSQLIYWVQFWFYQIRTSFNLFLVCSTTQAVDLYDYSRVTRRLLAQNCTQHLSDFEITSYFPFTSKSCTTLCCSVAYNPSNINTFVCVRQQNVSKFKGLFKAQQWFTMKKVLI